jgi:hypothetical protein
MTTLRKPGVRTAARLLLALPVAAGLLAAPAAHADWYRGPRGGWHGERHGEWRDHDRHRGGFGPGAVIAGALLGLGAAAVVSGAVAPPPVAYYPAPEPYYAPPPVMYYAPPPPVYYAPAW